MHPESSFLSLADSLQFSSRDRAKLSNKDPLLPLRVKIFTLRLFRVLVERTALAINAQKHISLNTYFGKMPTTFSNPTIAKNRESRHFSGFALRLIREKSHRNSRGSRPLNKAFERSIASKRAKLHGQSHRPIGQGKVTAAGSRAIQRRCPALARPINAASSGRQQ